MKQRDQRKASKLKALKRKIHLTPEDVWSWDIRASVILIRTPDHKTTHKFSVEEILGLEDVVWDPESLEEFSFHGGFSITPSTIKEKILELKEIS